MQRLLDGLIFNDLDDGIRVLLVEFERLFYQIAERERVQPILFFELHGLQSLASKSIANKAKLQVQEMWILGSELLASGFIVQVDDLFNCITDVEVVLWLVADLHVSFIKGDGILCCTFCWSLSFCCCWCCIGGPAENLLYVWLALRNQSRWPLASIV